MRSNDVVTVAFRFGDAPDAPVGLLALDHNVAAFEFNREFSESGLSLSPQMSPTRPGLFRPRNPRVFRGLHGVFADSLPDAWGELLFDRRLRATERSSASVTVLDRLMDVGEDGRGALIYLPPTDRAPEPHAVDLNELEREAQEVFAGAPADRVRELLLLGGSSGGARPKVQVWLDDAGHARAGVRAGTDGFTPWIVKFASAVDRFSDIGPLEAAYADVARAAGVTMPRTRLIDSAKGPGYFATERFDRGPNGRRIHMLSIAGMLDADWSTASIDYEDLMRAVRGATKNEGDVEQAFRRMAFNVAALNRDDHAKQHSLLYLPQRGWRLSPAYDLTFSSGPGNEHYLAVNGTGRNIIRKDLDAVAERQGIKHSSRIVDEVTTAVGTLLKAARSFGVSAATIKQLRRPIEDQLAALQ